MSLPQFLNRNFCTYEKVAVNVGTDRTGPEVSYTAFTWLRSVAQHGYQRLVQREADTVASSLKELEEGGLIRVERPTAREYTADRLLIGPTLHVTEAGRLAVTTADVYGYE